jgi:ATP-binding cassette, subfamily B, bacterial
VAKHAELLLLRKTAQSELARFDDPSWHDRVQRVAQDLNYRPYHLVSQSIGLLGSSVTLVGMMGVLLDLHPLLLLLAVVAVIIPMPFQRRVNRWGHTRS